MGISVIWQLISSKLGIIVIAGLLIGGLGIYHKYTVWDNQVKLEAVEKEKNKALQDLYQERQKAEDLEKTIKFQRDQLSLKQRVVKETGDVQKAVKTNNRDYLYDNLIKLHNYKNPTVSTPTKDSSGNGGRFIPKAKVKTP